MGALDTGSYPPHLLPGHLVVGGCLERQDWAGLRLGQCGCVDWSETRAEGRFCQLSSYSELRALGQHQLEVGRSGDRLL